MAPNLILRVSVGQPWSSEEDWSSTATWSRQHVIAEALILYYHGGSAGTFSPASKMVLYNFRYVWTKKGAVTSIIAC